MNGQPMGLRESLAIIATSLQGLLRVGEGLLKVAKGYEVRRDYTYDERRYMLGVCMDIPPERLNGPSREELENLRTDIKTRNRRA